MDDPKKVLIVRFSSIGDIVVCSPVLRCIKEQLSGVELHFLTKNKFKSLVDQNQYVDKIWTINKEIDEIVPLLKKEQFDLIIDLHKNLRTFRLKQKLGVRSINFDKLNVAKWLRVHTPINVLPQKHLVDRYFDAIRALGVTNDGKGLDFFYKVDVQPLLHKFELVANTYAVIVLGATYDTKRVPAHLIEPLFSDASSTFVIIGGNDMVQRGNELAIKYPQIINLTDELTLQESACIMDYSNVVISGDTGMMHIAAALKKPIVSIWGSTHHDLGMYPYYGKANSDLNLSIVNKDISCAPCSKIGKDVCPKGHFKCMSDLKYTMLANAIEIQEKRK